MGNQTFTTRRAIDVMDRTCAFLEERRRATSADVATFLGMSKFHAASYLVQLEKLRRIHCIERQANIQNGRMPTIWGPGATPAEAGDVDAPMNKGFVRQVKVRTNWAPNHVRMPMECLLFGVPAALQGVAA